MMLPEDIFRAGKASPLTDIVGELGWSVLTHASGTKAESRMRRTRDGAYSTDQDRTAAKVKRDLLERGVESLVEFTRDIPGVPPSW